MLQFLLHFSQLRVCLMLRSSSLEVLDYLNLEYYPLLKGFANPTKTTHCNPALIIHQIRRFCVSIRHLRPIASRILHSEANMVFVNLIWQQEDSHFALFSPYKPSLVGFLQYPE